MPNIGFKHSAESKEKMRVAKLGNTIHLGYRNTDESKQRMSEVKLGKHYSPTTEFKKGMIAPMKGRIMSGATKQKISLAKQGQTPWNKGLGIKSSENEKARKTKQARDWRKAIFERDDYTCQLCNERGGELNADHIQPFAYFPELRYELTNGRTLCVDCHRSTKTWGFHATNGVFNLA